MRFFTTKIQAIDPIDGKLKTWSGAVVPGINQWYRKTCYGFIKCKNPLKK